MRAPQSAHLDTASACFPPLPCCTPARASVSAQVAATSAALSSLRAVLCRALSGFHPTHLPPGRWPVQVARKPPPANFPPVTLSLNRRRLCEPRRL